MASAQMRKTLQWILNRFPACDSVSLNFFGSDAWQNIILLCWMYDAAFFGVLDLMLVSRIVRPALLSNRVACSER